MTAKEKLIVDINDKLMDASESFEPFAIYLAYLYPAIVKGGMISLNSDIDNDKVFIDVGMISLNSDIDNDKVFIDVLKSTFENSHKIWKYIDIR
jgi:hypothetical protein